ncbi:hypothetical protein [Xanthomonas axonopodis]|uniref:hypothetical protein n=1 Tax=Xanthomonas axonopodis TaxID=53413 RepID=UPI0010718035|nr:hypothetical protein [Xanthomonas axonopodis]
MIVQFRGCRTGNAAVPGGGHAVLDNQFFAPNVSVIARSDRPVSCRARRLVKMNGWPGHTLVVKGLAISLANSLMRGMKSDHVSHFYTYVG